MKAPPFTFRFLVNDNVIAEIALLLFAVGLYSLLGYAATQRTSEIGIRMTLGVEQRRVIRLILSQGMRLVGFGLAVGLLVALAVSRLVQSFLFSVRPFDPYIYSGVVLVFALIGSLACLIPSFARVGSIR